MSHIDGWYDQGPVTGDRITDPLPWHLYNERYGIEVTVDVGEIEWCDQPYPDRDVACRLPRGHDCPHYPVTARAIVRAGPNVGVVNIRSMSRQ